MANRLGSAPRQHVQRLSDPAIKSQRRRGTRLCFLHDQQRPRHTGIEPLPFGHSARATGTSSLHLPMALCSRGAYGCARAPPSPPRTAPQRPSCAAIARTWKRCLFKHVRRLGNAPRQHVWWLSDPAISAQRRLGTRTLHVAVLHSCARQ